MFRVGSLLIYTFVSLHPLLLLGATLCIIQHNMLWMCFRRVNHLRTLTLNEMLNRHPFISIATNSSLLYSVRFRHGIALNTSNMYNRLWTFGFTLNVTFSFTIYGIKWENESTYTLSLVCRVLCMAQTCSFFTNERLRVTLTIEHILHYNSGFALSHTVKHCYPNLTNPSTLILKSHQIANQVQYPKVYTLVCINMIWNVLVIRFFKFIVRPLDFKLKGEIRVSHGWKLNLLALEINEDAWFVKKEWCIYSDITTDDLFPCLPTWQALSLSINTAIHQKIVIKWITTEHNP